jgi:alanine racemase
VPNGQIAPVLKSNAYGHGLLEVAQILNSARSDLVNGDIPFFVVDSYFEAIALRAKGIKTPLLIIGYSHPETIANSRLKNISFTVSSVEVLHALSKYKKIKSPIHLKIDTGMHRQGILPEEVNQAIEIIKNNKNIKIEGIASHLSDADNLDTFFTQKQIILWNSIVDKFKKTFPDIKYFHISNTDGNKFSDKIKSNVSRLGIGLYGLKDGDLFEHKINLLPVLKMKTIITSIKQIKKGETVGYGNTFKALNDMRIATIPVGYFEGVDRRLSNVGTILVGDNNIPCPIIGHVSMNITSIDVSNVKDIKINTPVTVISDNSSDQNSIISIAQKCNTIPYEIVVKIPAHLKRVIV